MPEEPQSSSQVVTQVTQRTFNVKKVLLTVVIVAIVLVVLGLVFWYLLSTPINPDANTLTNRTATSSGSQSTASATKQSQVSLNVVKLETSFGIDGQTLPPYRSTVLVSTAYPGSLGAYGAAGRVIVGPINWTGNGQIGADGNISAHLYPAKGPEDSKIAIDVFIASTGTGSALSEGASYFPWIQTHWQELGMPPPLPTAPSPIIKTTVIAKHLVSYTLPVADKNLELNGVAFSDAQDHLKDGMWAFERMEIVLPSSQNNLALELLDDFIKQENLRSK